MHALLLVLLLATQEDLGPKVDAILTGSVKPDTPGCAVGIAQAGATLLERGYGMANLEYDAPITPSTIFEAGSVTKQFTAAAILLLAKDGKLSLDDRVMKYIPELDASAKDITIRQMLNHTSGLRDWGVIVDLAGWPRGTRRFTMQHVLKVISAQRELNSPPGTQYSYSNSGYNLAAIIVERVSGKSFPDFTRERLFVPNGMTHSSWRDDYTRVVKGRATGYDPEGSGYVSDMDIENIYGNCCLLTTIGDLVKWKPLPEQATPGVLNNGTKTDYGFGLLLKDNEYYHGGATAGYRAFLSHRNDNDVTIAILCNRGDAPTGRLVTKIGELFSPAPVTKPAVVPSNATEGLYRDMKNNAIMRVVKKNDDWRVLLRPEGNGGPLSRLNVRFEGDKMVLNSNHRPEAVYTRVAEAKPTAEQLKEYVGVFSSDEVGANYEIAIDGDHVVAKLAPARKARLDPTYVDGFISDRDDLIHFTRDDKRRIDGFDVKSSVSFGEGTARVERVHFTRLK